MQVAAAAGGGEAGHVGGALEASGLLIDGTVKHGGYQIPADELLCESTPELVTWVTGRRHVSG